MKRLIYLLLLIPIFTCGCMPDKKELYSNSDCSLINVQSGLSIDVFKIDCTEGKYRCFRVIHGVNCLKIEE